MSEFIKIYGYDVEIRQNEDYPVDSPLQASSYTLLTAHRNYTFGGVQLSAKADSMQKAVEQYLEEHDLTADDIIFQNVYLYEHSQLALSTSPFYDIFDSGCLGIIFIKKEIARRNFGVKRITEKVKQKIFVEQNSLLDELTYWCNGEVYLYDVLDIGECCGGFLGPDHEASGLIESAKDSIDYYHQKMTKEHIKKLKQWIKSKVGLQYRKSLSI